MIELNKIGADWLHDKVDEMADSIHRMSPVKFNEENRYLPQGVSPRPGYIRYDLFPFLREIIDCFAPESPVREVNLMKGVQTGYTTLLESIMFFYMVHVKTKPMMFLTADKELASGRVENNIIPMINESGFAHLIRSADEGNNRKTGKTKDFIQWDGGGFMIYNGAMNASKMRQYSVPIMFKDELDGWKMEVGKDGNSDVLTDARLSAYWNTRKILRGSTPLTKPSMIHEAYNMGDHRKYLVLCHACSLPQNLTMNHRDEANNIIGGYKWDLEDGRLIEDSVRYCCKNCGHEHFEYNKEKLFASESGAHWHPTAESKVSNVRSYHLPSFYSPYGFRPWSKCVQDYLTSYDPEKREIRSVSKHQEYYNNTLGVPYSAPGSNIRFTQVSGHRRQCYRFGEIPNEFATKFSGSKIMFLTAQVDVHKSNLAVSVFGWCKESRSYLIDYWRFERDKDDEDCRELYHPVWQRLRDLIESKNYEADDGTTYRIATTLIDANGEANATVIKFCSDYTAGVYPIVGSAIVSRNQKIKEFDTFKTKLGTEGVRIIVDHYKNNMAPVLRRDWNEEDDQGPYHFNAAVDVTDDQLKELTVEKLREKIDEKGNITKFWHRPHNAPNELWDLLVYAHASVDYFAYNICIQRFELDEVDWDKFWVYIAENGDIVCRVDPKDD